MGDPDQSIYGFQFASVANILNFAQGEYPNAQVYRLNRNYRSQTKIVEAANRLISRNANRNPTILRAATRPRSPGPNPGVLRRKLRIRSRHQTNQETERSGQDML